MEPADRLLEGGSHVPESPALRGTAQLGVTEHLWVSRPCQGSRRGS